MKILVLFALLFALGACYKGKSVDLIVHNAKIHTMDLNNSVHEAMAVQDGKVVEVGPERQILNKYAADEMVDAEGRDIYPGFTDAHGHMLSLMQQRLNLDLTGTKSFEQLLFKLEKYASANKRNFLVGRGWDQSLWENSEFPNNAELNKLYPNTPVLLFRVDGHAALVNDCLLKKAGLSAQSKIPGGEVVLKDGKPTGLLLDNAINVASALIPPFSLSEKQTALLDIQRELFQFGITGVHEAGIEFEDIALFKSLYAKKDFQLHLYAMLYPTAKNKEFAQKNGNYNYKNLTIRSFKVVGDGSLGSRGACLKSPYSDASHTHGFLTTSLAEVEDIASFARKINYQVNTHAIGDSTNKLVIDMIAKTQETMNDHRWRIEHAQVLDLADIKRLAKINAYASVQPTHAVSDQRWAEQRLGTTRLKGAYAYRSILEQCGMIVLGTDFPVEKFDPFLTIHAAVYRKDASDFPATGFLPDEKISLTQCVQGMTIWPAFASFQENTLGSLETGKYASFVILEAPLEGSGKFKPNYANATFIKGKKVYSAE